MSELINLHGVSAWGTLLAAPNAVTRGSLAQVRDALNGRFVYLATPYTGEVTDGAGRWCMGRSADLQARASRWAGHLALGGVTAFSPITISADIAAQGVTTLAATRLPIDPLDDGFWMEWCQRALDHVEALVIAPIDGWDRSRGIWAEVIYALTVAMIPVYLIEGDAA